MGAVGATVEDVVDEIAGRGASAREHHAERELEGKIAGPRKLREERGSREKPVLGPVRGSQREKQGTQGSGSAAMLMEVDQRSVTWGDGVCRRLEHDPERRETLLRVRTRQERRFLSFSGGCP
jgi:hypothetical protein